MKNTQAAAGPVLVEQVDLDQALPGLPERTAAGARYRAALVTVRLHGMPIAVTEVQVTPGMATPPTLLAALLWPRIARQVNAHLRGDGLPEVTTLNPLQGLGNGSNGQGPACQRFSTGGLDAGDVTVVVSTAGASPVLADLVRSVGRGRSKPAAIVVAIADDGSSTPAMSERMHRDFADASVPVHVVVGHRRVVAHARNVGSSVVETPVVAFLGDHVVPDPGWLDGLLRGFGRHGSVQCVTGLVLPAALDTPAQVRMQRLSGAGTGTTPRVFDLTDHPPEHPLYPYLPGAYGSGVNFGIRREALIGLGGFDERLGPGTATRRGEDSDLLIRTILAGHKLAYEPQALVRQHHDRTTDADLRRAVFGYGLGLGAVFWKQAVGRQARRELARRVPRGVRHLLDAPPSSDGWFGDEAYPASLRAAELAGILSAPLSYARSRRSVSSV